MRELEELVAISLLLEEDCLLLLLRMTEEEETVLTEDDEAIFWLELDGSPSLRFEDDDKALFEDDDFTSLRGVEDDEAIFLLLLEGRFALEAGMTDEEDEDDTLSSFADVPLSPPQAARAMVRRNVRKNRMDPLRFASRMTGRERHFAVASKFLILYSFFSSMCYFHTLQTSSIYPIAL